MKEDGCDSAKGQGSKRRKGRQFRYECRRRRSFPFSLFVVHLLVLFLALVTTTTLVEAQQEVGNFPIHNSTSEIDEETVSFEAPSGNAPLVGGEDTTPTVDDAPPVEVNNEAELSPQQQRNETDTTTSTPDNTVTTTTTQPQINETSVIDNSTTTNGNSNSESNNANNDDSATTQEENLTVPHGNETINGTSIVVEFPESTETQMNTTSSIVPPMNGTTDNVTVETTQETADATTATTTDDNATLPIEATTIGEDLNVTQMNGTDINNNETSISKVEISCFFEVASETEISETITEQLIGPFQEYVSLVVSNMAPAAVGDDDANTILQGQQRRTRQMLATKNHRKLLVTLDEESIVLVYWLSCLDSTTTMFSSCHAIKGYYTVFVTSDEDAAHVRVRYSDATQNGIIDGSFAAIVSNQNNSLLSQLNITTLDLGTPVTNNEQDNNDNNEGPDNELQEEEEEEEERSNSNMTPRIILMLILSVGGAVWVLLCFCVIVIRTRKKKKKTTNKKTNNNSQHDDDDDYDDDSFDDEYNELPRNVNDNDRAVI